MKCITLFFSFCLIAIFSIAQPNYDFSKLKRERLGRGVIAIRENHIYEMGGDKIGRAHV